MGELPVPGIGRLMEAMLVSFIDHGATPPSTLAARNTATTGAPLRACVAAGVLGFGRYHGGDIESCMQFLDNGLDGGARRARPIGAAAKIVGRCADADEMPPGFGHRYHTRDPRAARLFQMALELELEGEHIQMIRAVEMVLHDHGSRRPLPVNIDGAIAAVCGDLGHPAGGRQRAVHHLARPRDHRAGAGGTGSPEADAADRSEGSSLRRSVATTAA